MIKNLNFPPRFTLARSSARCSPSPSRYNAEFARDFFSGVIDHRALLLYGSRFALEVTFFALEVTFLASGSRFLQYRFLRKLAKMPRRLFILSANAIIYLIHLRTFERSRRRAKGATPFTTPSTKPKYLPLPPKIFFAARRTPCGSVFHVRQEGSQHALKLARLSLGAIRRRWVKKNDRYACNDDDEPHMAVG